MIWNLTTNPGDKFWHPEQPGEAVEESRADIQIVPVEYEDNKLPIISV